jgi:hypothetical protein
MRSHESFDEFAIGFGELIRVKFGWFHPSTLGNFDGARLSTRDRAVEEMQFDGFRRVVMRDAEVFVVNVRFDIELFAQFPSQRGFQRFAGFHFAAGKFPQVWKMHVRWPLGQQDVLVSMNDGCSDNDHRISISNGCKALIVSVWLPSLPAF